MINDKLPPQAIEFEELIVGAMMLNAGCIDTVLAIPLHPEHFYKDKHRTVFSAIIKLYQEQKPTHIVSVTQKLRTMGMLDEVGGPYEIVQLTNRVVSSDGIDYHCRIVIQQYLRREAAKISYNKLNEFYDENRDIFESIEKMQQSFFDLVGKTLKKTYRSLSESVQGVVDSIVSNNHKEAPGINSGFPDLDNILYGWQKSDLVIVAARPGMGKTSFVLSSALETAKLNMPVAMFSLEMSEVQLVNKILSSESEIPLSNIRQRNLSTEQIQKLNETKHKLDKIPFIIDDTPALSIFEFRAKARRLKQTQNIQLIIVDYLQLMTASGSQSREAEISFISRSLKAVAKELDVPIIALSQMSRKVEERGKTNNRPQLSDLRESGAIEQDADIVLFLYRPEYYKQYKDTAGNDLKGVAEIIIAKHRNGNTESVYVKFIGYLTKFTTLKKEDNLQPDYQHEPITEQEF